MSFLRNGIFHVLEAVSPIDGRYASEIQNALSPYFSENALMKYKIFVEIKWIQALLTSPYLYSVKRRPKLSNDDKIRLDNIYKNFSLEEAKQIKLIESKVKHDVKSIEYFLREKTKNSPFNEYWHFACTSEDINNNAYGLALRDVRSNVIIPTMEYLSMDLDYLAQETSDVAMLARTHGQPATPTTMGKELTNFIYRLEKQMQNFKKVEIMGKMNGAVGNYNAHVVAFPEVDWIDFSKKFVSEELKLSWNPYSTQIEPHDYMSEYFDTMSRYNTILLGLNRDIWTYISMKYFKQKVVKEEVGSSTMPHKVNPIHFENSEGNIGIANSLFHHFSTKLPISRLQRDLSDSTVLRNIGAAIGYSILAYNQTIFGLNKLQINEKVIQNDLKSAWQVLAEPIQTVMRSYNIENSYEILKEFTRGNEIDEKMIKEFIQSLNIPEDAKKSLMELTPEKYVGYAKKLTKNIHQYV